MVKFLAILNPSFPLCGHCYYLNKAYVEMVIWLTPPPKLSTWFMYGPKANMFVLHTVFHKMHDFYEIANASQSWEYDFCLIINAGPVDYVHWWAKQKMRQKEMNFCHETKQILFAFILKHMYIHFLLFYEKTNFFDVSFAEISSGKIKQPY